MARRPHKLSRLVTVAATSGTRVPWGHCRRMGRTDRSSIVIPAARGRIYAALLDPSALETWLPPDNMRSGLAASLKQPRELRGRTPSRQVTSTHGSVGCRARLGGSRNFTGTVVSIGGLLLSGGYRPHTTAKPDLGWWSGHGSTCGPEWVMPRLGEPRRGQLHGTRIRARVDRRRRAGRPRSRGLRSSLAGGDGRFQAGSPSDLGV